MWHGQSGAIGIRSRGRLACAKRSMAVCAWAKGRMAGDRCRSVIVHDEDCFSLPSFVACGRIDQTPFVLSSRVCVCPVRGLEEEELSAPPLHSCKQLGWSWRWRSLWQQGMFPVGFDCCLSPVWRHLPSKFTSLCTVACASLSAVSSSPLHVIRSLQRKRCNSFFSLLETAPGDGDKPLQPYYSSNMNSLWSYSYTPRHRHTALLFYITLAY